MDSEKVIQDLNQRFAKPLPEFYKRRIIFWCDEEREFEDQLDKIVLSDVHWVLFSWVGCGYDCIKTFCKEIHFTQEGKKKKRRRGEALRRQK